MISRYSLSAMLISAVGLIILGSFAPWGAPKAVADGDRLGCGTYCQNAGGFGAPADPRKPSVTIASGNHHPDDGHGTGDRDMRSERAVRRRPPRLPSKSEDPALLNLGMAGSAAGRTLWRTPAPHGRSVPGGPRYKPYKEIVNCIICTGHAITRVVPRYESSLILQGRFFVFPQNF